MPAMQQALHDADDGVAGAAVYAVASFGDPAIPALTEALKRKQLRPAAARILGQMGSRGEGGGTRLGRDRQDRSQRPVAERGPDRLGATDADPEKVVPAAVEALQSRREEVRVRPASRWGELGSRLLRLCPNCRRGSAIPTNAGPWRPGRWCESPPIHPR